MKLSRLCASLLVACVAALTGCDHATKLAAVSALRDRPAVHLVPGLDLAYAENRDVAFDLFTRLAFHPVAWLLAVLGAAGTLLLVIAWSRLRGAAWPTHVAFALLVAGALGNFADRAVRGFVVDFIKVPHWPVFNVADVLVVAGGALLAVGVARRGLPARG